MGKLISLGYLSIHLLFPFLTPILNCVKQFVSNQFPDHNIEGLIYLLYVVLFLSQMLCGIFELISKIRQKTTKSKYISQQKVNPERTTLSSKKVSLLDSPKKTSRIVYFFLILISFLDLLSSISISIITLLSPNVEDNVESEIRIIQIVFLCFLCKIFLKYSIHRHHIVSIIIIGIGMSLVCLDTFSNIAISSSTIIEAVLYLLCYLLYAIQDVIEKHIMEKEYISPFGLLFFEGLFGIIFLFILFCISFYIPAYWYEADTIGQCILEIFSFFFAENPFLLLYLFLFILASVGYNLFIVLTNYYFSPSHIIVSDTLSSIITWILTVITNKSTNFTSHWYYVSKILGFILIFLGSLIYNEIIICHIHKLDENTKKQIIERAKRLGEENFSIEDIDI